MLPSETMIWQPEFTDKTLSRKPGAVQWAAIGVLGSLVFGLLTYLTNLYFKIKEDKRKAARGE
ncbi:Lysozyme [Escherichia coli]|uniref:Lysozyme n=1 Tax=Escherichia coli TaxID=562 RepID=A0AB38F3M6_ECOLX|nr:Lysozyme [Escherichia coli]